MTNELTTSGALFFALTRAERVRFLREYHDAISWRISHSMDMGRPYRLNAHQFGSLMADVLLGREVGGCLDLRALIQGRVTQVEPTGCLPVLLGLDQWTGPTGIPLH